MKLNEEKVRKMLEILGLDDILEKFDNASEEQKKQLIQGMQDGMQMQQLREKVEREQEDIKS